MAKKTKLTIHVVLDRSGSMNCIRTETIGAFNGYVEKVRKDSPDSVVSLTLFDKLDGAANVDTIIDAKPIKEVQPLTEKDFEPRGWTPLYDAIGKVVAKLDEAKGKNKVLVILTDGHENASTEFTRDAIKKLLDDRQEKKDWLVIYLGANQDAFAVGAGIGIAVANSMNYDTKNIGVALAGSAASTMRYASGGRAAAAFTEEEREASK